MMVLGLLMSARDGHALLLAAGDLVGIAVGLFLKADKLEHIGDALFDLARRCAYGAHGKAQILVNRLLLDQAEILKDDADCAAQQRDLPLGNVRQAEAVDSDLPLGGRDLAGEQLDDSRFSAAAGTDKKDELPILDAQRDAPQRLRPAVIFLYHVAQPYHALSLVFGRL